MTTFRWAGRLDHEALGELMHDAVRNGKSHYSEEQRAVWVPEPRKGADWSARLDAQDVVVAEQEGEMVGFMSLGEKSYLDFAYIRPKAQGTGLFRQLLARIVGKAQERGEERIWVHASLMAHPAFAKHGFEVVEEQVVTIADQDFRRYEMERWL
ncbi:GNAT family N-acetyltransferase [Sphingomicrobium nitratireducens]|uniref:GNAT family N-acetyltransferase n=1 Tax=Sphingomicrobium nitratireducens TaxID=2964666 RepID=UPI00223FE2C6|nr:GNAT family N-acetyltransferase [Sphingomicrobium nitratireducens]